MLKPLIVAAALAVSLSSPTEDASVITTDTMAYCTRLADRMATLPHRPRQALDLHEEGVALCAQGRPREGINRLRREALIMRAVSQAP